MLSKTDPRKSDAYNTDTLDSEPRRASARNTEELGTEPRGANASNTDTPDYDSSARNSSISTTIDTTGTIRLLDDGKELHAVKLSRQTENIALFESHL